MSREPIERKVSAAAFAGAAVAVVLGIVSAFGVDWQPDPAWVAALTTLVAVFVGWLVPSKFNGDSPAHEQDDYVVEETNGE
jgi:hypothetical protein